VLSESRFASNLASDSDTFLLLKPLHCLAREALDSGGHSFSLRSNWTFFCFEGIQCESGPEFAPRPTRITYST